MKTSRTEKHEAKVDALAAFLWAKVNRKSRPELRRAFFAIKALEA